HLPTMEQYTFIAPITTVGSVRATSDLIEKIKWMRKVRCPPGTPQNVYPTVMLDTTWMPTRHPGGGRQRPHFKILPDRWVRLGSESPAVALPPPETVPDVKKPTAPAQQITAEPELPLTKVPEPTLREELNDDIPEFDEPHSENKKTKAAPSPRSTA